MLLAVFLVGVFCLSSSAAMAKNVTSANDLGIPEKNGIFNVPGQPELKVRVFVHYPRIKPSPAPSPLLVCGLSDPDSSAVVGQLGWKLPATWKYTLNPYGVPASVGSQKLPTIANQAFAEWTSAIGKKVNISQNSSYTTVDRAKYDGKNIIAWGRTSGSALAVTYTWYNPSTGFVVDVDTIMNQKFPWSWTPYNLTNLCADKFSYDAQNILAHELGHWYGLDDEYEPNYADNTMFGYGSKGEVKKDTLEAGDIAGVAPKY